MTSGIICPTCGLANAMSSKFCRGCGAQLEVPARTPPASSTTGSSNQPRKCATCGQSNDAQNVRCLRCGNDLV